MHQCQLWCVVLPLILPLLIFNRALYCFSSLFPSSILPRMSLFLVLQMRWFAVTMITWWHICIKCFRITRQWLPETQHCFVRSLSLLSTASEEMVCQMLSSIVTGFFTVLLGILLFIIFCLLCGFLPDDILISQLRFRKGTLLSWFPSRKCREHTVNFFGDVCLFRPFIHCSRTSSGSTGL